MVGQHGMSLLVIRQRLTALPDAQMAADLGEILAFMDTNPDPQVWLEEHPRAVTKVAYWLGELESAVRYHKIELEKIEGYLDMGIRKKVRDAGAKVTDAAVEKEIAQHDDYVRQARVHAAWCGIIIFLKGVQDAWNQDLLVQKSVNWRKQGEPGRG